jgi:60 kDa SS-A/Ro ribonucleoprotein
MANKALFQPKARLAKSDHINEAGGMAYRFPAKHALAQYAVTGCLNATFYANARTQLDQVLRLCAQVEPAFVAQTALYARRQGYMKDMPALLTAWLACHAGAHLPLVFEQVIDNGRMLRNFVQILRSGALGRQSLGSLPKRLVQDWLNRRSPQQLLAASVGRAPSLADIIRMVHPKPESAERAALYAYLIGKPCAVEQLPPIVRTLLAFKAGHYNEVPDVPFQLLTALNLQPQHWVAIACQAPWQMTRMNLNTFARHGVFQVGGMTQRIAERLRDPAAISKARVFPYQLLTAYTQCNDAVPELVREALRDALQIALANVPELPGNVYVLPDVSGSMQSPVTGYRQGATTAVRCVDVAALIASALLAKNPRTRVLPFDFQLYGQRLRWQDGVLYNARKLANLGGGGTDCSVPLREMNARKAQADLVIYVSDNESWIDSASGYGRRQATQTLMQWDEFKKRNAGARLICIDIQPYGSTQAHERADILNIGGFSDSVFEMIQAFAAGQLNSEHWVGQIEKMNLD